MAFNQDNSNRHGQSIRRENMVILKRDTAKYTKSWTYDIHFY